MKAVKSGITGNTIYHSDDGRFSSMSQKAVKCWDETMHLKDITREDLPFWQNAGYLRGGK